MARKKKAASASSVESKKTPPSDTMCCHEGHGSCDALAGISEEVQSFLSRRDDLAEKLAREIEATELKLAELKRSAALLYPERHSQRGEGASS